MLTRKEVDLWGFDAGEYRDTAQQLYEELDEARRLLERWVVSGDWGQEKRLREMTRAFLESSDAG